MCLLCPPSRTRPRHAIINHFVLSATVRTHCNMSLTVCIVSPTKVYQSWQRVLLSRSTTCRGSRKHGSAIRAASPWRRLRVFWTSGPPASKVRCSVGFCRNCQWMLQGSSHWGSKKKPRLVREVLPDCGPLSLKTWQCKLG